MQEYFLLDEFLHNFNDRLSFLEKHKFLSLRKNFSSTNTLANLFLK